MAGKLKCVLKICPSWENAGNVRNLTRKWKTGNIRTIIVAANLRHAKTMSRVTKIKWNKMAKCECKVLSSRKCLSKLRQTRHEIQRGRGFTDYVFKKRGVSFTARINHKLGCTAITSFLHSFSFFLRKQSRVLPAVGGQGTQFFAGNMLVLIRMYVTI